MSVSKKTILGDFIQSLLLKITSISDIDDTLIDSEINDYLQTEEDHKKLYKLLKRDKELMSKDVLDKESSDNLYTVKFSNGKVLVVD